MNEVKLQILTPEKQFFDDMVEIVVVKGMEGSIGVMYDHEPFVTPLGIGMVKIKQKGESMYAALSQGFIETMEDKIVILADTAEWPQEIDLKRAEEAKKRAEERLKRRHEKEIDTIRAEIALKKAITRIDVSSMPARHK